MGADPICFPNGLATYLRCPALENGLASVGGYVQERRHVMGKESSVVERETVPVNLGGKEVVFGEENRICDLCYNVLEERLGNQKDHSSQVEI